MLRMSQVRDLNKGDNSYKRKLATRLIILSLSAFFISQVIPTLAEEQDPATEVTEELSPSAETEAASEPEASETTTAPSSDQSASPTATPTASPSPSPSVYPARPSQSQGMVIKVPNEISVDPRAQIVRIPRIEISGPAYLLVCVNTVNTVIDVLTIGAPDNANATNLFIQGDISSTVTISAPTLLVNNVFNASGGAKISALGRSLAGQQIQIGFLAIDKQADDSSLCPEISPENRRVISIKGLGVGIGMKKGEVKLKR
jgi:hypothetical protein